MNKLKVYDLCLVALLAGIEYVIFNSFSNILYLELITFTICLFALSFSKEMAILASILFGSIMLIFNGINFWNIMYIFIYPSYSLIIALLKKYLLKYEWLLCLICGFLSFLTGQLLQLPFMLFSQKLTILYVIMGLKTSLLQGAISFIACKILFKPCYNTLRKLRGIR